jgi:hypothetical protein
MRAIGWYGIREDGSTYPTDCDVRDLKDHVTNKRLAHSNVGFLRVSTIFMGLDHRHGLGAPLIFETLVFPHAEWLEVFGERYSTYEQAMAGHAAMRRRAMLAWREQAVSFWSWLRSRVKP